MRTLAAALLLLGLAASAPAQDTAPPTPPARKHTADARALELVRKADLTTYRATDAGLKSLRCRARYQMTNGIVYEMAYAMEAPGKSTLAIRTTASGAKGRWEDTEREKYRSVLDGLFAPERLEQELEPCTLELRAVDGVEVVVARRAEGESEGAAYSEYRFLPEGPLAEDGPGAENLGRSIGVRQRITYAREGDLHVRKKAALDGYGKGFLNWKHERVGGILVPTIFVSYLAGLGGSMTISEIEVNVPVTGPATLPEPPKAPTQEELDALDVEALISKVAAPYVGPSPDPVTAVRTVRALAKKGDDAKRAIPALLVLVSLSKWQEPEGDARPADYENFQRVAVKLLAQLRPESIRPLVAALKSPSSAMRQGAAEALGLMGADGAEATDALLAALDGEPWQFALDASVALRKIGCPAEKALPALLRQAAVQWVGDAFADQAASFAKQDPDGDRKLVAAFVDGGFTIEREADGRKRGLELLFAKHGARLAPLLAAAATTGDASRRERIACALACAGRPAFVVLAGWIDGDDAGLRFAALRAVHWSGKDAEALVPKIGALLASSEAGVADEAEASLVRIGEYAVPGVLEFIASRPKDGDDAARDRARGILERQRTK